MEMKKILWPTDFSSNAEAALPHVQSLTEKYQAEIHVLYVIEDTAHHEGWYGDFDKTHVDKLMERGQKTAQKRLDQICEKYLEGCPLYIIKAHRCGRPCPRNSESGRYGKDRHGRYVLPGTERSFFIRQCG